MRNIDMLLDHHSEEYKKTIRMVEELCELLILDNIVYEPHPRWFSTIIVGNVKIDARPDGYQVQSGKFFGAADTPEIALKIARVARRHR